MNASELLDHALKSSGFQVTKVFEGMPESLQDAKLGAEAMSPRETLAHLTECYHAVLAALEDKPYEWGSYTPPSNGWDDLVSTFDSCREQAAAATLASSNPSASKVAMDYMVQHDAYHVGQIAQLRILQEPGWNAYSIYEFA